MFGKVCESKMGTGVNGEMNREASHGVAEGNSPRRQPWGQCERAMSPGRGDRVPLSQTAELPVLQAQNIKLTPTATLPVNPVQNVAGSFTLVQGFNAFSDSTAR